MNSGMILGLLAARHARDVFVPECKDGPTHFARPLILDAWAMTRSWANPRTIGYEIKVSRADFLRDDKWEQYMAYCREFYLVCPAGVLELSELPQDVGLLQVTKTGRRLLTKRKAVRRKIEIPEDFWRYVVMCRARIVRRHQVEKVENREYWVQWLAQKEEDRELGYQVSRAIRETTMNRVLKVEGQNTILQRRITQCQSVLSFLQKIGVDPDHYDVRGRVEEYMRVVPRALSYAVTNARRALEQCETAINVLGKEAKDVES